MRGYEAQIYNTNASDPAQVVGPIHVTCDYNTTFESLLAYHLYNITVRGFTSIGPGNRSDVLQCLTDEDSKSKQQMLD